MDDYHLLMDDPNLRYVPLTATLSSLSFFHELRSYSAALGPFPFAESVDRGVLEEFQHGYEESLEFVRRFSRAGGRYSREPTRPGRLACLERAWSKNCSYWWTRA